MTPAVITTVGLVGLFMSLAIDGLVVAGKNQYNNAEIASTMGLVAFSPMLVVAAFESRDEKASILRVDTFDNRTLNITAVVEIALALLIARGAALPLLLGAAALTSKGSPDRPAAGSPQPRRVRRGRPWPARAAPHTPGWEAHGQGMGPDDALREAVAEDHRVPLTGRGPGAGGGDPVGS